MDFYLAAVLQGLCFSGLALGIYLSMKIFNIPDITTDGSYTLGGTVTGIMLAAHIPQGFILPAVLLSGGVAGGITGFIHTKLRINALLAGILVMTALYSVNLTLMGRSNLPLLAFANLFGNWALTGSQGPDSLIVLLVITAALVFLLGYVLRTDFGIAMRATGNSESMVRALGVNTDRMKITGLAMANALTATSGYLVVQLQGFADINMGIGIVITGLGSVVIGETIIRRFRVVQPVSVLAILLAGAVLFQLALAVTLTLGIDPTLLKLVTALFVLLIVSLPRIFQSRTA
ncbi:ABC transporter permease [Hufsiella ginkgonis]|uniref:ABC transporter permease n=1 Tax=Hufsiella ginkgonis TaxID=2695274 RepID=A0A7K1Y083_9SPHI|nr:ABC transporter permease [Hufsiella ginkgonis]MXV16612.1 ABC transporter permease [Hufsiella ginkgonis]